VFVNLKVFAQKLRETRSHYYRSELVQNERFRPKSNVTFAAYHIEKKRFWILRLQNFERKKSQKHKYRGTLPANLAESILGSRHAAGGTTGRPARAGQASQRRRVLDGHVTDPGGDGFSKFSTSVENIQSTYKQLPTIFLLMPGVCAGAGAPEGKFPRSFFTQQGTFSVVSPSFPKKQFGPPQHSF
jgi:hypothetical protein